MKRRRPTAGLSLLETMFALLIMAMMAMMVSGTMASGIRVLARSGVVSDEITYAMARRDLRRWLEHALPELEPGNDGPVFIGERQNFKGLVLAPDPQFWAGKATQLTLGNGPVIVASGVDPNGTPQSRIFQLAPDGYELDIRYWGRRSDTAALGWSTSWDSPLGPPTLIKINFIGQDRPIPPLTIRLGKAFSQSEMSLSSLVPPALPSRP